MKKSDDTKQHGGPRPNSGRPPLDESGTSRKTFVLANVLVERAESLLREGETFSEFIRAALERECRRRER